MKHTLIPSLLLALILSACGGGGGSKSAAGSQTVGGSEDAQGGGSSEGGPTGGDVVQPPVGEDNNSNSGKDNNSNSGEDKEGALLASQAQRIAYYGDSTIEGCRTETKCGNPSQFVPEPPTITFENYLRSRASALQSVTNEGVSSQSACDLNDGWSGKMASSNATVIILNHGINDANPESGISQERYSNCLTSLAQTAKNAGKRVIFETPSPVDNSFLEGYVEVMRTVAAQEGLDVIDQYTKWNTELEQLGGDRGTFLRDLQSPDGTHPMESFYRQKGEYAAEAYLQLPL